MYRFGRWFMRLCRGDGDPPLPACRLCGCAWGVQHEPDALCGEVAHLFYLYMLHRGCDLVTDEVVNLAGDRWYRQGVS